MTIYHIAWWNLENLYDDTPWEEKARKIKNLGNLKDRLKHWKTPVLEAKLTQLSSVIKSMNNNQGPDILGVCELESKEVLEKLVAKIKTPPLDAREYEIVHIDTEDQRGIDLAFVYDKTKFGFYIKDPNAPEGHDDGKHIFAHPIIKRSPTRHILQVNFKALNEDQPLILIANHWPSRLTGTYLTEPYRIIAAETLAYYNQRIHEVLGKDIPIIVMGDFNDDPGDRSMTDYALSCRNEDQVVNATSKPKLLNLMWPLMNQGYGSYWYDEPLFFDQFLISKAIVKKNGKVKVTKDSVKVLKDKDRWESSKGDYPKPRRFGWNIRDPLGWSDHFPITMQIEIK